MVCIQGVPKMLAQTSRVSFSHHNREKVSDYHMPGNVWISSVTEFN